MDPVGFCKETAFGGQAPAAPYVNTIPGPRREIASNELHLIYFNFIKEIYLKMKTQKKNQIEIRACTGVQEIFLKINRNKKKSKIGNFSQNNL